AKSAGKKRTDCAATSNITPDTKSKLAAPIGLTSQAVILPPIIAPNEPPMLIKPKRRLPCSLLKRSVMNAQNTVTTKRLATLSQTKNALPNHASTSYRRRSEERRVGKR